MLATGKPRRTRQGRATVATCAAVALWLAAWQAAAWALDSPILLAGPVEVAGALARLVPTAGFWARVGFSLARIAAGCLGGYAVALALAAASSASPVIRTLVRPPLVAVKSTPVVCVVVLLLIWVGSANVSVAAVCLMVVPSVYFPVLEGLGERDRALGEMLSLHGVRGARRLLAYTWPQVLPFLTAASETVVGMSWKAGVAAELIGSPMGSVGERIYQAKLLLETDELFAWTLVVVVLAWTCERLFLVALRASGRVSLSLAVALRPRGGERPAHRGCAVCVRDVAVALGGHEVLRGVSLELGAGDRVCVMGSSGAGKTTLLRVLAGLLAPDAGEVGCVRASMEFQEARLVEFASALDNVLLTAAAWVGEDEALRTLGCVLPGVAVTTPVCSLSGGQRRRVELVRALLADGDLVVLDEPFAGLDDAAHEAAAHLVLERLEGRTLVVSTHDERDACMLDAREVRLGDLVATGSFG